MAIIPSNIKFVGISPNVDTTERKSARLNSLTEVYTLQDFNDSLTPDLAPITVGGNSVSIASDPTATTQTMAVIQASTLNSGIAIVPNGTGAITAQVPDATVAGGNARGTNAVDLQVERSAANEVASGNFSVISGGQSNKTSSGSHATVVGGQGNTSSSPYSISGGASNNSTGYASVAMGSSNTASGGRSVVFGNGNIAVGNNAVVLSGVSNQSNGDYSISNGYYAKTYLYNQRSHGNRFGAFGSQGDSQISELIASKFDDLTSVGTTVLSLDGTGITNLIIPTGVNRVWSVLASWVAVVIGTSGTTTGINVGDVITQCNLFAFKKIAGISSVVGSVTNVATHNDSGMASASMGYTAGASQELALTFQAPTFGGGGSVTLRIVNKLTLTEVAYT